MALRPRALAVLRYIAERPGQLVTKEELLKHLWPGLYVTQTVLRVCVHAIRHALQDNSDAPQFIETVGREGYRFIGVVSAPPPAHSSQPPDGREDSASPWPKTSLTPHFVGREQELARLRAVFEQAQQGERQVVFLPGEAGIGKTALVDRFVAQVRESGPVRIGRGQCLELHGPGEAYLPILEALGQLCREAGGEQVLAILRRYAPRWLVQIGGLLEATDLEALQRHVQGSSQERMLREFAEAVEIIAADTELVFVFEDLQWSDPSTVEALAYLARRRRAARLHLIGTYRPADVVVRQHPLRRVVQELYGHGHCEELTLELFTAAEVEAYLGQRFGQSPAITALSQMIHHSTDGNALFLVHFVEYLLQQGLLVTSRGEVGLRVESSTLTELVPETLQQLLTRQIEALHPEAQRLLGVASVAGMTFTAAEVAGVVGLPLEEVEVVYDTLVAQEHFLVAEGIARWPDGTVTGRYSFRHALYQRVLYEQVGQARRMRLHRRLGEQKAAAYGDQAEKIAGELAVHFTQGGDASRAALYHDQAGTNAFHHSAYREALDHCQAGLAILAQEPDTPTRQRQELVLRMLFAGVVSATQGFNAAELLENLCRAQELCLALHDDATLVSVLVALGRFYDHGADRETIEQHTDEKLRLLERVQEPILALQLHTQLGTSYLFRGMHRQSQAHHTRVLELYDPQQHRELVLRFSLDPMVPASGLSSASLWLVGCPDQARARLQHSLNQARDLGHPYSLCMALACASRVHLWCGALMEAEQLAAETVSIALEHDIAGLGVQGRMQQACIRVQRGEPEAGLSPLLEDLSRYRGLGAPYALPSQLCFVADAYRQLGRVEEGLATVEEAIRLTETYANVWWAAEVYRLKGEILLAATGQTTVHRRGGRGPSRAGRTTSVAPGPGHPIFPPQAEAEACLHTALDIARQQEAKSLELRAAMSLSRLWQAQGKTTQARQVLATIYSWFTEGFDTRDMREARVLLARLTQGP
jgi:DNA-binding winged helix-turn-helix (wHTH) protein/tetratricopeptide (TPR) repeat protein